MLAVAGGLLAPAPAAAEPVVLSVGHTDAVAPTYADGAVVLKVKDDTGPEPVFRDPADVVFHAKAPGSEVQVPPNPNYAFLGAPGSTVWLLPQIQDPNLVWPGFSSEQIPSGVLEGDALGWRLTGVQGPGELYVFQTGGFGALTIAFRSDQALPQARSMLAGVHAHFNWAFTAPGRYTLRFEVTGTPVGGEQLSTGAVEYTFVVGGFDDLGVELAVDGRKRYAPGDTVRLRAVQTPRTVLADYRWFAKCPDDADFTAVEGATTAVHTFAAELAGDGCQYRASVHTDDGQEIARSEPVTVRVAEAVFRGRTVLSAGHVDAVATRYEDGALAIEVKDDTGGGPVLRDPSDVVLHAKVPESQVAVPEFPEFGFLGAPGAPVWILPQLQNREILWAGFSSEEIASGTFASNRLTWTMTGAEGPGRVFLYVEDFLGLPDHRFRSDRPLPQSVPMATGTHDHFNWAFTAPGRYTLTFQVSGTLAGGGEVTSGEVSYEVLVGGYADLGVRLSLTGAEGEHAPGAAVTLSAGQDPATDLDHYGWFRRCGGGDFALVPGALDGSYSFTAAAGDDECEYMAALYDHDDNAVAESDPVTVRVRSDPDPLPGPQDPPPAGGEGQAPGGGQPSPPEGPRAEPLRLAVRLHAVTVRKRVLTVRLRSSLAGRATVRVLRGRRVIARGRARAVRTGVRSVRFTLNRALKHGRYRVRVRVVTAGGATVRTIPLRIPRR